MRKISIFIGNMPVWLGLSLVIAVIAIGTSGASYALNRTSNTIIASPTPTPLATPAVKQTAKPTAAPTPAVVQKDDKKDQASTTTGSTCKSTPKCNCTPAAKKKGHSKKAAIPDTSNASLLNPPAENPAISLAQASITLKPGEQGRIHFDVKDSTSDVLVIDPNSDSIDTAVIYGTDVLITAANPGKAQVTVYLKDKDTVQRSISVTVTQGEIANFESSGDDLKKMVVGEIDEVSFTATTANGTTIPALMSYKLSDPTLAELKWDDADSLYVTAKKAGQGTITIIPTRNPARAIEIPFTIADKAIRDLVVPGSVTLTPGETADEDIKAVYNDNSKADVEVSSSNPDIAVATYIGEGKIRIVGNHLGSTLITVKAGDKTNSTVILVKKSDAELEKEAQQNLATAPWSNLQIGLVLGSLVLAVAFFFLWFRNRN